MIFNLDWNQYLLAPHQKRIGNVHIGLVGTLHVSLGSTKGRKSSHSSKLLSLMTFSLAFESNGRKSLSIERGVECRSLIIILFPRMRSSRTHDSWALCSSVNLVEGRRPLCTFYSRWQIDFLLPFIYKQDFIISDQRCYKTCNSGLATLGYCELCVIQYSPKILWIAKL